MSGAAGQGAAAQEDRLAGWYRSLSPVEQWLLTLVAIVYEPVAAPFLAACLAQAAPGLGLEPTEVAQVKRLLARFRAEGVLSDKNQLDPERAEWLTRRAVDEERFEPLAALVESRAPLSLQHGRRSTRCWRAMRQCRLALYREELDGMEEAAAFLAQECRELFGGRPPEAVVFGAHFDAGWFARRSMFFQFTVLDRIFQHAEATLEHYPGPWAFIQDEARFDPAAPELVPFVRLRARHLLLRGETDRLEALLDRYPDSFQGTGLAGALASVRGRHEEARGRFREDLERLRRFSGPEAFFPGLCGHLCAVSWLASGRPEDLELVRFAFESQAEEGREPGLVARLLASAMLAMSERLPKSADVDISCLL